MSKQDVFDTRKKYILRIKELSAKFDSFIIDDDDDECGIPKLEQDAPTEIKEAYDEYLRLVHAGTAEDRKMKDTWFQIIKPYAIFKAHVLAGITEDAPTEVKEAYEKLKRSGIRLSECGATVRC